MTASARPLVVCLVGTDHHPFERLVSWCDTLATGRPDIEVLVQHGRSTAPRVATGRAFLDRDELDRTLRRAQVAISHGGPGLISEIRAAGLHPLVVPRDPDHGEHVDGHQLRFVGRVAKSDIVESVGSELGLLASVERRLSEPRGHGLDLGEDAARVLASVERFGELVEQLFSRRR